jgi:hypothetical protein
MRCLSSLLSLALLPNGYKILLTYCGILVWTQLWAPLYAVLNLVMTLYGKSETKSLIGEILALPFLIPQPSSMRTRTWSP